MDRLSDWRAAAWVAFCLAALAAAAAVIVPAAVRSQGADKPKQVIRATLVPRTHLFGQVVTATLEVPAGYRVKATFSPYRVLRRTVTPAGNAMRYQFTLDCLRAQCVGSPGSERKLTLPPAEVVFPDGRKLIGIWPPVRQASRLAPDDLRSPQLRGEVAAPPRESGGRHRLTGLLIALAGGLALIGAGALGFAWLGWRPRPQLSTNGKPAASALDYALLVTGIAAGGGQENRRAALESLAIALEERGLGALALEARELAWSPQPPAGETVRRLTSDAQHAAKEKA